MLDAAGTPRYEDLASLVGGIVRVAFEPPLRPLDSGFRRKDEVGEATYEVSALTTRRNARRCKTNGSIHSRRRARTCSDLVIGTATIRRPRADQLTRPSLFD